MKKLILCFLSLSMLLNTACGFSPFFDMLNAQLEPDNYPEAYDAYESESKPSRTDRPQDSHTASQTEKKYSKESEFEIENGVLLSYHGTANYVIIPDGVTRIAACSFWSISEIESIEVPSSVKTVEGSAFWSCQGLRYVNFSEGLETVGGGVFWSCQSLTDINLPASVTQIADNMVWAVSGYTLHVPQGSYAEEYAMRSDIPYDNTYAAFVPHTALTIRPEQYAHSGFRTFEIAEEYCGIDACAFEYCENLEYIEIPSNIRYIGAVSFQYCSSLRDVNILDGCTEIGNAAFEYCTALTDINIPASVQKIGASAFHYTHADFTIHTPKGSYAEQFAIAHGIPYDNILTE